MILLYIVQQGDTVTMIANRFNANVKDIIENNWVGTDMLIVPGQILFIRREDCNYGSMDSMGAFSMLQPFIRQELLYVVQRGDTLATIAKTFDTTVEAIVEANHLEGPGAIIYPGQILRIPIIGFR